MPHVVCVCTCVKLNCPAQWLFFLQRHHKSLGSRHSLETASCLRIACLLITTTVYMKHMQKCKLYRSFKSDIKWWWHVQYLFVRCSIFVYNHDHFRCSYAQSIVSQDDELSLVSSQDDELSLVLRWQVVFGSCRGMWIFFHPISFYFFYRGTTKVWDQDTV